MQNIFTIAHKFLQEARRNGGIVSAIFIVSMLMIFLPYSLKSDGTLKGHIQLLLNYELGLLSMLLYGISLFFAIHSFTYELTSKQYYLLETKPVKRWEFYWGKFVGVAILNVFVVIILGAIAYSILLYWKECHGTDNEKASVQEEIFTTYASIFPNSNTKFISQLVDAEITKSKQEHTFPEDVNEVEYRRKLQRTLEFQHRVVGYGYAKEWTFQNIPQHIRMTNKKIKIRYKFLATEAGLEAVFMIRWEIGKGASQYVFHNRVKPEEYLELILDSNTIAEDNSLQVRFIHDDRSAGLMYFPQNTLELLYPQGGFITNYSVGVLTIYFISCFLAGVGIFAATFLTFPTALFLGSFVLFLGIAAGFLHEVLPDFSQVDTVINFWSYVSKIFLQILYMIIPNLSDYSPQYNLSTGRTIPFTKLMTSFGELILFRVGLLGTIGCLLFSQREIGKPID